MKNMGEPKMPTPKEMAEIQKQRTLSDAKLIDEGAEYRIDESGNSRLEITKKQGAEIKKEMNDKKEIEENIKNYGPFEDGSKLCSDELAPALGAGDPGEWYHFIEDKAGREVINEKNKYFKEVVKALRSGATLEECYFKPENERRLRKKEEEEEARLRRNMEKFDPSI